MQQQGITAPYGTQLTARVASGVELALPASCHTRLERSVPLTSDHYSTLGDSTNRQRIISSWNRTDTARHR
jgi:hypothetical protein